MGTRFSLNGLSGIWSEALNRNEPTIAFELVNGRGRFLFLMFFDPDDERTRDTLFLFLQNSCSMLLLKLYGAHRRGEFMIYPNDRQIAKIKHELALSESNGPAFDIARFIDTINGGIPKSLSLASKVQLLRANVAAVQPYLGDILDDHDRTELVGELQLDGTRHPREKTLRKLYWYRTESPQAVATYIQNLKKRNCTLRWRVPSSKPNRSFPGLNRIPLSASH